MNSKIKILVILLALIMSSVLFTVKASAQQINVSFQIFYDQLSPYGQWVDYPDYGYVWIPDAGPNFVPYSTGGYWVLTEYGWAWVSDYHWGWAPFHYGRWDYNNSFGWFWVPDYEWGPAWVTWRRANGYYGWAPMEPGISISVSFGRDYRGHNNHWIFVRDRYFDRRDVNRYYVNQTERDQVIINSTVINNTYVDNSRHTTYVTGPGREDVQKNTGRSYQPVALVEKNEPGQDLNNGQLHIYRPRVVKDDSGQRPVPGKVIKPEEVKRTSVNNSSGQLRKEDPNRTNTRVRPTKSVDSQNNQNNNRLSQPRQVNPSENKSNTGQREKVNPQNNGNNETHREAKPTQNSKNEQRPNTNKQTKSRRDNRH